MARYTAYLIQAMSQVVEFDAPDNATREELEAAAVERHDLFPNISNDYDTDGDVAIHYVKDSSDTIVGGEEFRKG